MKAEDSPGLQIGRMAVLGAGKMGETLISALLESSVLEAKQIVATAKHLQRLEKLAKRFGVETTLDNREAAAGADLVLLCVKPQVTPVVLEELSTVLQPSQLLVSIVAGLTTATIEERLPPGVPVARAMPNTPSRLGVGMTAVCGGRAAQTCLGAAHMVLETGQHPAQLKDEVTTPAGCTIDGILKLEEGGLRVTLIKAIVEAAGRARELVDS